MSESANLQGGLGDGERTHPVDRLERARDRVEAVDRRIEGHGEETVEAAADAYHRAATLLDDYVDRATGTGRENFKAYVELEGQFDSLVDGLPDDLAHREAFESALEAIDKRRLSESDFDRAEAALEPAEAFADLLDEREEAAEAVEAARTAAAKRLGEIDEEIAQRERVLELGGADLEAPVERVREPIDRYDDAVSTALGEYLSDESAREVFSMLERSRWYPLVPFERPPADLRRYVERNDAGESTIPTLLEYADYSRSKLDHYVDDADELKRRVATQQTFLEGIDAEPLTISWPPAPAADLEFRIREIRPFAERVGGEDVVAALRAVQSVIRDDDYDRLQTAAVATDRLDENERRRLADGSVAAELESLRAERERIRDGLDGE